ncbi:MAG: aminotransferase class V-fold PLP-dependent enzyme [Candidatus Brocadiae bacterium]|nr:aminotransferase class V-fold PLP-dependent enzyme [Candidatus Brocadiia bacterium]
MLSPKAKVVYFDNPATSFPKPEIVVDAIAQCMKEIGGNPGRSGHRMSMEAGEQIFFTREVLSDFFGVQNPMKVIFCSNATDALNLAIQGLAYQGGHAITSSMEHNSTIRPLYELEKQGKIRLSIIPCSSEGLLSCGHLENAITKQTSMVVINHSSNAFGTEQPIQKIGEICKNRGIAFIVDSAQSAGILPLNMAKDNISILAFSGHKGLYGPMGTGGLIIADDFNHKKIRPLKFGGTGSLSDKIEQPDFLPDCFESGTLNVPGVAGLRAGILFIKEKGLACIRKHKEDLVAYFLKKARAAVPGFLTYIPDSSIKTGIISFNIQGFLCSEIANALSEEYNIMSRQGLHCSPLAHKSMGTFPHGTVRFGFSIFNTKEECDLAIESLQEITQKKGKK